MSYSAGLSVSVVDPFGVREDPKMPFLARALDPEEAQERVAKCWARAKDGAREIKLRAIRVGRHKPGRRCLIEYEVQVERKTPLPPVVDEGAKIAVAPETHRKPSGLQDRQDPGPTLILIGKARAKGADKRTHKLLQMLWRSGFNSESQDGIFVPQPIGLIPEFRMWLQRKVGGVAATQLLPGEDGAALARRIAEAAHKLHRANIPTSRCHTMADELRILHERLALVTQMRPEWNKRLERLLAASDRLGLSVPEPLLCGIHRDFYPAHVLVDGPKICLLDCDLYCQGDPALDIGNFLGHLTEHSLRSFGDPDALKEQEQALEDRFVELSGEASRPAVQAYAKLTLVRHIFISAQVPERPLFTESLIALCEERLAAC